MYSKMYVPCKKCDMDSHGSSMSFYVTNRRQFGPNPHQIPWLFHVIYTGFVCFLCIKMAWMLDKLKSWNSMAFAKKMMGFTSDLGSFSKPTKLPSKSHEKITFYRERFFYFHRQSKWKITAFTCSICQSFDWNPIDIEKADFDLIS